MGRASDRRPRVRRGEGLCPTVGLVDLPYANTLSQHPVAPNGPWGTSRRWQEHQQLHRVRNGGETRAAHQPRRGASEEHKCKTTIAPAWRRAKSCANSRGGTGFRRTRRRRHDLGGATADGRRSRMGGEPPGRRLEPVKERSALRAALGGSARAPEGKGRLAGGSGPSCGDALAHHRP